MNKEASTQIAGTMGLTKSSTKGLTNSLTSVSPLLRSAGIVLLGSMLLAVCSHLSMPLWFTPVPLSLQPFGVLLLGLLLTPGLALATTGVYLLEGAAGLPVFAPGTLGLAHLLGPTGGFLMAYPLAALVISALWRRGGHGTGRGFGSALASAAVGDVAILICGALWLAAYHQGSLWAALSLAAVPFLPGDALKVAAAAGIAVAVRRVRQTSK